MSRRKNKTSNAGLEIAALIALLTAFGLLAVSKALGDCTTTAAYGARYFEGFVIFLQLLMLGGGFLCAALTATRNARSRRPLWGRLWKYGIGLFLAGTFLSGFLLGQYGGFAACTDGLFGWVPF